MAKDGGDFVALWALHVHEVGFGALHQALLVLPNLLFQGGMKEVLCEWHIVVGRLSHIHTFLILLHRGRNSSSFNLKSLKGKIK